MPQTRERLRSTGVANIKRFERLVATTQDNVERTNLMKLLAAEYAALDQLAAATSEDGSEVGEAIRLIVNPA